MSPATVERLFTAARRLFATAPWSIAADTQVLRMDVPALDVEGPCVSILGQATGRHGVLIFPSLDDFAAFIDAASDLEDGPIDLGSGWLALLYERAADLPPSMHREAMQHGWPVESPDAYPVVERRDPDGVLPARRAGRRDRRCLRPVTRRIHPQARGDVLRWRPPGRSTTSRWTAGRRSRRISSGMATAARRTSAPG